MYFLVTLKNSKVVLKCHVTLLCINQEGFWGNKDKLRYYLEFPLCFAKYYQLLLCHRPPLKFWCGFLFPFSNSKEKIYNSCWIATLIQGDEENLSSINLTTPFENQDFHIEWALSLEFLGKNLGMTVTWQVV